MTTIYTQGTVYTNMDDCVRPLLSSSVTLLVFLDLVISLATVVCEMFLFPVKNHCDCFMTLI